MTDRPTSLYRLFNAKGDLLYIGISGNPTRRWREHRNEMLWWREVDRHEREWYASEGLAFTAEGEAIFLEQPRYNKSAPGPVLPAGVSPQPLGLRLGHYCKELRPALRREWFMWRLHLQDGLETERETLRWIILLMLRARLAQMRDQGRGAPTPRAVASRSSPAAPAPPPAGRPAPPRPGRGGR